jgi:hypothetical protein
VPVTVLIFEIVVTLDRGHVSGQVCLEHNTLAGETPGALQEGIQPTFGMGMLYADKLA